MAVGRREQPLSEVIAADPAFPLNHPKGNGSALPRLVPNREGTDRSLWTLGAKPGMRLLLYRPPLNLTELLWT